MCAQLLGELLLRGPAAERNSLEPNPARVLYSEITQPTDTVNRYWAICQSCCH